MDIGLTKSDLLLKKERVTLFLFLNLTAGFLAPLYTFSPPFYMYPLHWILSNVRSFRDSFVESELKAGYLVGWLSAAKNAWLDIESFLKDISQSLEDAQAGW